ncbi:MAG: hypothetical protein ACYTAN_09470 [Planctomycetota bacterium]
MADMTMLWSAAYIKDPNVFECPSASFEAQDIEAGETFTLGLGYTMYIDVVYYGSYGSLAQQSTAFGYDNTKRDDDAPMVAIMADRPFGEDGNEYVGYTWASWYGYAAETNYRYADNIIWEVPDNLNDSPFDCNSPNHWYEGQNVLYVDGHVSWSGLPTCGYKGENIFYWDATDPNTTVLPSILQPTDSYVTRVDTGWVDSV